MKKSTSLIFLFCLVCSNSAYAFCRSDDLYFGAGMKLSGNSDVNIIGGYCLEFDFGKRGTKTALELSYGLDNLGGKGKGVDLSGVAEFKFKKLRLLGRISSKLDLGAGMVFKMSRSSKIRAELGLSGKNDLSVNWVKVF